MLRFAPSGRSFAIGAALVLLAGGLYALARETSMFAVRSIEVEGASPALAAEVRAELRSFDGRSLVALNGDAVEQRIERPGGRPQLGGRPGLPAHAPDPCPPGAAGRRAAAGGGVVAGVGARACHRDDRAPSSSADLPRIWLPSRTEIAKGAFLTDEPGALAARSLAAFVGSGFSNRIAFVRALDGQITLGLRGGLEIQLGAPIDLRLKIAIARGILPTLALPGQGGPDYLDITVPERPVAGRNPQPSG